MTSVIIGGELKLLCFDDTETRAFNAWCWGKGCTDCNNYIRQTETALPAGRFKMVSGMVLVLREEEEMW